MADLDLCTPCAHLLFASVATLTTFCVFPGPTWADRFHEHTASAPTISSPSFHCAGVRVLTSSSTPSLFGPHLQILDIFEEALMAALPKDYNSRVGSRVIVLLHDELAVDY